MKFNGHCYFTKWTLKKYWNLKNPSKKYIYIYIYIKLDVQNDF